MFFATAPKGIEPLLADELTALGATSVKATRAGVFFEATLRAAYRVCLWSRLASRVIMKLTDVDASSSDRLYDGVREAVRWSDHVSPQGTLAVDFTSHASEQVHTRFGAQRVKDAIVDQLRDAFGERPSVDVEQPDLRVNVFLENGIATIGVDLSGESLHRRGYREEGGRAPLKENLAAAVLTRAQIRSDAPLVDPMCGSATLLIEGASMLADIAPGLGRAYFGFVRWRGHDTPAWDDLVAEARERRLTGLQNLPPIVGYEPDGRTVSLARENIRNAGLDKHITIEKASLASLTHELPPGVIVTNPPYGVRLSDDEGRALTKLYEELGATLKAKFAGWRASVLVPQGELAGALRLRGDKRYSFFNGAIPCWLFTYGLSETPRTEAKTSEGETAFANRLRKNVITFGKWAAKADVECYRVYDGDIPEYALAVDRYGKYVHVQEYQAPKTVDERMAARRLREALHALPEALGVDERDVFVKVRKQQKGTQQYEKQDSRGNFVEVRENGHTFWVNFTDYLDTGLFLDHRDTRKLVGEMARGKRMLNLFAYTCTASVYAAKGGAVSTTSVDASRTYLDWAESNFRSNGLARSTNDLVQDDVMGWLAESRDVFDLIFVDPPTFSNSKDRDDFDIQRDHIELLRACTKRLSPDGVIVFSNNYRRFKLDTETLARGGMVSEDITAKTIPKDFERNARIHKCYLIRRQQ